MKESDIMVKAEITIYEDNREPKTYSLVASEIKTSTDKSLGIMKTEYYYKFVYTIMRMGEVKE